MRGSLIHPAPVLAPVPMILSIIALVIASLALVISWRSYLYATERDKQLDTRSAERDKQLDTRSVIVTCRLFEEQYAQIPNPNATNPAAGTHTLIEVSAVNNGHRPVEIRAVHFLTSTGRQCVGRPSRGSGDKLPKHIADGESANVFFRKDALDGAAAKDAGTITSVIVTDAESHTYEGNYPA